MEDKKLEELTDAELLEERKKMKTRSIYGALVIGIMIGVIIWSIVKHTVGLFTLIPLYLIYKIVSSSKDDKALKDLLKERRLNT